jgi:type I restriction enzyme M protein
VDFAARRATAVEAATPHWQRAEAERNAALALSKPIRELEQTVQAAANGDKAARQEKLRALKAEQQAREQAAKSAQAEGDALYWPIYNLDLKNPHARAGLEHADPKDLIASMRSHEAEVMRLLGEIETLVGAVGGE